MHAVSVSSLRLARQPARTEANRRRTGSNVGALIIRIGFWGFLIIVIVYCTSPPPPPTLLTRIVPYLDPPFCVVLMCFLLERTAHVLLLSCFNKNHVQWRVQVVHSLLLARLCLCFLCSWALQGSRVLRSCGSCGEDRTKDSKPCSLQGTSPNSPSSNLPREPSTT